MTAALQVRGYASTKHWLLRCAVLGLGVCVGIAIAAMPPSWTVAIVGGAVLIFVLCQFPSTLPAGLLLISSVEGLEIPIGPADVRPPHLIAALVGISVVLTIGVGTGSVGVLRQRDSFKLIGISLVLCIPSVIAQSTFVSASVVGLFVMNFVIILLITHSLQRLGPKGIGAAMKALDVSLLFLISVPAVQTVLGLMGVLTRLPGDQRLFSFGRPPGTFSEAGWAAVVAGFALLWFIARRKPFLASLALAVVVVTGARTTVAALFLILGITILRRSFSLRWSSMAIVLALVGGAVYTWISIVNPPPKNVSTLDTRALDAVAVLRADPGFWGQAHDSFYDRSRDRTIANTTTNFLVDGYQKLGVPGIIFTLYLVIWMIRMLTRVRKRCHPSWVPLVDYCGLMLAACVLSNALGRAWFWLLIGVGLSVDVLGSPAPTVATVAPSRDLGPAQLVGPGP